MAHSLVTKSKGTLQVQCSCGKQRKITSGDKIRKIGCKQAKESLVDALIGEGWVMDNDKRWYPGDAIPEHIDLDNLPDLR